MGDLLQRCLARRSAPGRSRRRGTVALWIVLALVALWLLFHLKEIAWAFGEMGGYLQYRFIRRALVVGILVSLCAALLGLLFGNLGDDTDVSFDPSGLHFGGSRISDAETGEELASNSFHVARHGYRMIKVERSKSAGNGL